MYFRKAKGKKIPAKYYLEAKDEIRAENFKIIWKSVLIEPEGNNADTSCPSTLKCYE